MLCHQLVFYFEAHERVDFRELVSEIFSLFKTRIWMQQVDTTCLPQHEIRTQIANNAGFLASSYSPQQYEALRRRRDLGYSAHREIDSHFSSGAADGLNASYSFGYPRHFSGVEQHFRRPSAKPARRTTGSNRYHGSQHLMYPSDAFTIHSTANNGDEDVDDVEPKQDLREVIALLPSSLQILDDDEQQGHEDRENTKIFVNHN